MQEIDRLRKRIAREQAARKQAEQLLEERALQLFHANEQLKALNQDLEGEVRRKTAELEQQKERYQMLVDTAQDIIFVLSRDGYFRYINPIGLETVGYSEERFKQTNFTELIVPEHVERVRDFYAEQIRKKTPKSYLEFPIVGSQGEVIWIGQNVSLQISNGEIVEFTAIARDISDRITMETKIRRSEEKYRGILQNMDLGLMEVNREGIIIKPYPKFCEMTGYAAEELIGQKANDVLLPQTFLGKMMEEDEKRKSGQTGVYEVQLKTKSGRLIWVMIGGAPFYNDQGEVVGSVGIHYDITHQKELQQELEAARWEAERARDAEKDFLANMSHEIRNPINSVVGMTNLLFDTQLDEEQKEYLNNIKYSSDILLSLISDILDLSKITEGKMEPDLQPLDLEQLVQAIAQTTRFRLRSSPVDLILNYDPDIPRQVTSDVTFLNQILMNLIGNAVKFTQEGTITLSVELAEADSGSDLVTFLVADTGVGIADDQLENIFERFNQAGKATASRYGGTGLGLPITKKLVELLGGSIDVQSKKGVGTRFSFQLSLPKADVVHIANDTRPESQTGQLRRQLSVLIVEDNTVNRLYLERTLQNWGYHYDSCQNGKEALEQLQQEQYDLILMDIRMPEMDGYETTIRLRSYKTNPNTNIPIIALTASALKDEKEKALAAGMNHHITKPFTREQLEHAIARFFAAEPEEAQEERISWPVALQQPELQELYGDDPEYALMIFEVFLEEAPEKLEILAAAIAEGGWEQAGDIAHQIKPHFRMVGWPDLSDLVERIEKQCRQEPVDATQLSALSRALQKQIQTVFGSVEHTIVELKSFLNQTNLPNEVSDR